MHHQFRALLVLSVVALGACESQGGTPALDTEDQKASYGIGLNMGSQLQPAESRVDLDAFMAGVRDGMTGAEPALAQDELQAVLQAFSQSVNEQLSEERAAQAETNTAEGEEFLAENAQKPDVQVTESGLQYEVLEEGDGPTPGPETQVSVHYRGTLLDGTEFDSSYERGEPAQFSVDGVIDGFSEGLQLMPVGSKYRFYIPSELGYGPQGAGQRIGPNATLIFEVELLEIVE